jgi:hypothetical protein
MVIFFFFLFFSCNDFNITEKIEQCDLTLFEGVMIETRGNKDGQHRVLQLVKEENEKQYTLPNYEYSGCQDGDLACLRNATTLRYNVFEYAGVNGITDSTQAMIFCRDYVNKVVTEYAKIGSVKYGIYRIVGLHGLKGMILFNRAEDTDLLYAPKRTSILEKWEKEYKVEQLSTNWYSINWKATNED